MGITKENKMGTMPVGRLLLQVSLPIIVSMFVQALYNIVDSIFVAKLSEDALAAVSLVFPVQNLMIAVAVGTGVGINSLISRTQGEGDPERAGRVAVNGVMLSALSWLAFVVVGIVATGPFFDGYLARGEITPAIAQMGKEYMYMVTIASLGVFISITYERLLQSSGRSIYSMVSQIAGAVTNIVLDPIMIFGLLGFPAMGVLGAALATVIGQFVSMFLAIYLNHKHNEELVLRYKGFRPEGKLIKEIYRVGLPAMVMQSIGSVMVFAMNSILVAFGTTPVSVLGVYFKLQSFVFMPVFGMNNGMVPVIGYNYGAKKPQRIERAVRICTTIAIIGMAIGTLLFWVIPRPLLGLFDADAHMMEMGVQALRAISLSFVAAGISIVFTGFFQALGEGLYSLFNSFVRQVIVLLPVALLLSRVSGLDGIWYAFPIAEAVNLVLAIIFFRRVWRKDVQPMMDEQPPAEAV